MADPRRRGQPLSTGQSFGAGRQRVMRRGHSPSESLLRHTERNRACATATSQAGGAPPNQSPNSITPVSTATTAEVLGSASGVKMVSA